ncbi:MAG: threonylcarbamoyl-AMP synthase [Phycisphaeraceae bacterium]|nr:threonylcarbamoyl-AMP synthase [Phycisphaerales bacterium]MCB9859136.1 threonylcarbamoyl-AMP synthase [Phycisphaeraceae bacterium]
MHLRRGAVVAFPTETVWGLGVRAADALSVERLYILKGRPRNNPMALLVRDVHMARSCASNWSDGAEKLAREFWPGALTLVVPSASHIHPIITAHSHTVGLRCPDHPIAQQLIAALDEPLVATSANVSGQSALASAAQVRETFEDRVGHELFVLDVPSESSGSPSTVYDVENRRVLREGSVTQTMIEHALHR